MARPRPHRYPRKAEIERVVSAVRASGVEIGAVRVGPDGTICVSEVHPNCPSMAEFDRWEAEGRL